MATQQAEQGSGVHTAVQAVASLLHARYGVIRGVELRGILADSPSLFLADAQYRHPGSLRVDPWRSEKIISNSSGAGLTAEEAVWSCIGEAVERYTAMSCPSEVLAALPEAELPGPPIDLAAAILYSDEQYNSFDFPCHRYAPGESYQWAAGRRLLDGSSVFSPHQLVWLGPRLLQQEHQIIQSVSTGLAGGQTPDLAIASGLYEVVERDSFMTAWLLRRSPLRIRVDKDLVAALPKACLPLLAPRDADVFILDLTTDNGIPAICVVVWSRRRDVLAVGAACHPDIRRAVIKALVEAHHTSEWGMTLEGLPRLSPSHVTTFEDHVRFFRHPANSPEAQFFVSGDEISYLDAASGLARDAENFQRDPTAALRWATSRLEKLGHSPSWYNLTGAEARAAGVTVVRVLVPSLQPMHAGMKFLNGDMRRLANVARFFGLDTPSAPNPIPHPFP